MSQAFTKRSITFGIHQPGYHRYCGYFYKMLLSDIFISGDTVQFVNDDWQNRQKFYYAGKERWLSVPVNKAVEPIMSKRIMDQRTLEAHWRRIEATYRKTPFFRTYADPVREIYSRQWVYLNDLCDALTLYAKSVLGIDTVYIRDSQNGWVDRGLKKGERIIDCIQRTISMVEYDEVIYLPCASPMKEGFYLNKKFGDSTLTEGEKILQAGITLSPYPFRHPTYRQYQFGPNEPFVPRLSIFDLIFNCGETSREVLESAGKVEDL